MYLKSICHDEGHERLRHRFYQLKSVFKSVQPCKHLTWSVIWFPYHWKWCTKSITSIYPSSNSMDGVLVSLVNKVSSRNCNYNQMGKSRWDHNKTTICKSVFLWKELLILIYEPTQDIQHTFKKVLALMWHKICTKNTIVL